MNLQVYDPKLHQEIIRQWLIGHQMPGLYADELPQVGILAEQDSIFYAACFLRRMEGCSLVMMDGLIANPKTFGKARYHALDAVIHALLQTAKDLGASQVIANSIDAGTLKRIKKHGFRELPHTLIAVDLL